METALSFLYSSPRSRKPANSGRRARRPRRPPRVWLAVEAMEERAVPPIILSGSMLSLYGDQAGYGDNDTVTIDTPGGGIRVTITGTASETVFYNPGQVTAINVHPGGGENTVDVFNTYVPVAIVGHGLDSVNLGNSAIGVQGITANVSVSNSLFFTALAIDDRADTTGRTATITSGSVSGLAPGTIFFEQYDLDTLQVYGRSGGNDFYVEGTPPDEWISPLSTYINSGSGTNHVNMQATSGSLALDGGDGLQSVTIGSQAPYFSGTLGDIHGSVNVYNSGPTGSSWLSVDDSGDPTGQTATLSDGQISGLTPAPITWSDASPDTATGGIDYVQVVGGSGYNGFTVAGTGNLYYGTLLMTGTGGAEVGVQATSGPLHVYNWRGLDAVTVGNVAGSQSGGTLANIQGTVTVDGPGSSSLEVDDRGGTSAHFATLSATELSGLSPAPIRWTASAAADGRGVTSLTIDGSAAASTYYVTDTPRMYYRSTLATGGGADAVYVLGTTGGISIDNAAGRDAVTLGGLAPFASGGTLAKSTASSSSVGAQGPPCSLTAAATAPPAPPPSPRPS
jgi:hypothetical protein